MKYITPEIFGQMFILSTIIADNVLAFDNVKYQQKKAFNLVSSNYKKLKKDIIKEENMEAVFLNWDALENNLTNEHKKDIFICRQILKQFLRIYDFNGYYKNKFKAICKNSKPFI